MPETMNISVLDLVRLSLDVAKGCRYLEENRFVHRWVQHTITFVIGQGMFFLSSLLRGSILTENEHLVCIFHDY